MKAILFIIAACASLSLSAGPSYLKLPDGRILRNPYLLDQTPSSVTIGHDDGALSVPLKDLSSELQKELGYDPAAAAAEEARLRQARKSEAASNARAQAEVRSIDNAAKVIDNEQQLNARIQELEKQLREAQSKSKTAAAAKPDEAKTDKKTPTAAPAASGESFSSVYGDSLGSRSIHRYKTCREL
ncbi:MAG: hypothetical protein AB7F32_06860 [Victivallaceae bacterium]